MRKKHYFVICLLGVFLSSLMLLPSYEVKAEENTGERMSVKYKTHVQNIGWQPNVFDGQMAGTSGLAYRLEGITIALDNAIPGMKIKYQTHVQNVGWQNWVYDGQVSGTSGFGYRLEGIKIMLEGAPAGYHIQYQVHVQNLGWQDWVTDGAMAGTSGKSLRLEGIRVRIVKEGTALMGGALGLKYRTHVQAVGWQDYSYDGEFSGTEALSYRLEGINIELVNPLPGMKIKYQTHVQNVGWQEWKYDGDMSGTSGKSLRLEGIKIKLENAPAWLHVKYQVHVQNLGWQDWVSDGEEAGTVGKGLRLEGIRIRIYDSKNYTYVTYNISLNDMITTQMARTPAMQMKNSSNQWEWRYAEKQNGLEGYFIYVPKLDAQGNPVLDANGKVINEKKWTISPFDYQVIKNELVKNVDVNSILQDSRAIYQFLKLSYVDGTTAEQLNANFSSDGMLAGKGAVFIDAAKKYNINPIYLAAHSMLETGNGTSSLAKGIVVNGTKVYNLFGIQAYDNNADVYGSQYAYQQGWTDIDKAIYGGAQWISNGYINNTSYRQDTLYKMRWNPSNPGVHQYATDVKWAYNQTVYIKQCFDMFKDARLIFEIPVYK